MNRITPKTVLLSIVLFVATLAARAEITVEPVGLYRYDIRGSTGVWGAGADIGARLNAYVSGAVRLVAYETPNSWRGGAIDEVSVLVTGDLLRSANKKVTLSAIGGPARDFNRDVWGLSVGPRLSYSFTKNVSLAGEAQLGLYERGSLTITPAVTLGFSF